MMLPVFDIALFRTINGVVPKWERQRSQKALLWMLEALAQIDQQILITQKALGKPVPPLYSGWMHYQRENGTENWQDVYRNLELGDGDCEDIAAHRVAELRTYFGRRAMPFVTYKRRNSHYGYHALVAAQAPDGVWRIEDPSRKLGMGWENQYANTPQPERLKLQLAMDKVQKGISPALLARLQKVG